MLPGLLVASPQMRDPNFEHTVVLLVAHGPSGSLGVVVNRTMDRRVGDLIEDVEALSPAMANRPVLVGGPVEQKSGFALWRGEAKDGAGWTIGHWALSPSRDQLTHLVANADPFWLCLGYAGWGPGQLERELIEGSWVHLEDGVDAVLDAPLRDRYDLALSFLGVSADQLWMSPVDE